MADFARMAKIVHPVFVRNGWEYFDGIPSEKKLAQTFASLGKSSEKIASRNREEPNYVTTGRLRVDYHYDKDMDEGEFTYSLVLGEDYVASTID